VNVLLRKLSQPVRMPRIPLDVGVLLGLVELPVVSNDMAVKRTGN